jgi:hypothetical protein
MAGAKRSRNIGQRSSERPHGQHCTPQNLCARCSMMKVIQYRFAAFRQAFGRDPLPNEPLFFVPVTPIAADKRQAIAQLSEAARATGVQLGRLLEFLHVRST